MDEKSPKASFFVPAQTVAPVALTLLLFPARIVPNLPFEGMEFLLPAPIVAPAPLIVLAVCVCTY